jgi:CSLREA domain-containing protein
MFKKTYPNMFMSMIVALLALVLLPVRVVSAAPAFTVNSIVDEVDDNPGDGICHSASNHCTLRAAVMEANRTSGLGATIILPSGIYTLTIPASGAEGEEKGDLNLTTPAAGSPTITLTGAGAGLTIIDANQIDRVVHVHPSRVAVISNVTIRNGYYVPTVDAWGGGIYNQGTLTVSSTTISGNYANAHGGGIYNRSGIVTVMDSTLSQNIAHQSGGGIYNYYGLLTVVNSTLSQNTADQNGGGIANDDGTVKVSTSAIFGNGSRVGGGIYSVGIYPDTYVYVINGTISQNYANYNGGGIYMSGKGLTALYNTSVIDNDADHDRDQYGGIGGGVYSEAGSRVIVVNTLIAGNTLLNAPIYNDCSGMLEVYGMNLLFDETGCTFSGNGSASWGIISLTGIGPLQNNGGPTRSHALLEGSVAIDSTYDSLGCVNETGALLTTDQRGAPRPVGPRCDIGAFEYNPARYIFLPFVRR